jgi:tetratricopeptide (TPR) repeat protein
MGMSIQQDLKGVITILGVFLLAVFFPFTAEEKLAQAKRQSTVLPGKTVSPSPAPPFPPLSPEEFEQLQQKADQAREAGQIPAALQYYGLLVNQKQDWAEGWWYLGTLLYETDQFQLAAVAFEKLVALDPKHGQAWAFLGLSEYRLKRWPASLNHLLKAKELGLGDPNIFWVVTFHQALLLNHNRRFEEAYSILTKLAYTNRQTNAVLQAFGCNVLRFSRDFGSLTKEEQQMVQEFGRAAFLEAEHKSNEAFELYQSLERKYRGRPNVAYAMGAELLLRREDEKSIQFFQAELKRNPRHFPSLMQLALIFMASGEFERGLPFAQRAANLDTRNFAPQYALGRIYLYQEKITLAISCLEKAVALEPNHPAIYYSLAQAYQKANRPLDSEKARAEFARLTNLRKEQDVRDQNP